MAEFRKVCNRPSDYDAVSNLIALSEKAAEAYSLNPTVEEFKQLLEIKKFVCKRQRFHVYINYNRPDKIK